MFNQIIQSKAPNCVRLAGSSCPPLRQATGSGWPDLICIQEQKVVTVVAACWHALPFGLFQAPLHARLHRRQQQQKCPATLTTNRTAPAPRRYLSYLDAQVAVVAKVFPGVTGDSAWDGFLFKVALDQLNRVVS
jgi:hypothetical protein